MVDIISIIFTDTQVNECFSISQAEDCWCWTVGVYITKLLAAVLPQKSNKLRHETH